MAITASTINKNRTYRSDSAKALFEDGGQVCNNTTSFNQGDLQCFDTATKVIRSVVATTDAATFVGVAQVGVINGVLIGPYTGLTNVTPAPSKFVGAMYGITASMILKTGDAFADGDKVYLANGADCQTVSITDPGDGNYIGIYVGPPVAAAAAGQEGLIKIGCRYPSGTAAPLEF